MKFVLNLPLLNAHIILNMIKKCFIVHSVCQHIMVKLNYSPLLKVYAQPRLLLCKFSVSSPHEFAFGLLSTAQQQKMTWLNKLQSMVLTNITINLLGSSHAVWWLLMAAVFRIYIFLKSPNLISNELNN